MSRPEDLRMPRVVMSRNSKAERKAERQKVGTLKSQVVRKNTADGYSQSFHEFRSFANMTLAQLQANVAGIDQILASYIEFLWKDGEPKSYANYVVASVQHFVPEGRRRLGASWKLVSTWNKIEMPSRAVPMTPELLLSFAGILHQWKWESVGFLIVVGFSCFLRTGEMFRLRREHAHLPVRAGQPAILFLEDTKTETGQRKQMAWEKVLVKGQVAVDCLKALCAKKTPREFLADISIYQFRKLWKDVVKYFKLDHLAIQPYSIRRGGATSSYKRGMTFEELLAQGRWKLQRECLPGWTASERQPERLKLLFRALLCLAEEFNLGIGLEEPRGEGDSSFISAVSRESQGGRQSAWEALLACIKARRCLQNCYVLKYHWEAEQWRRSRLRNWVPELEGIVGALESAIGLTLLESQAVNAGFPTSAEVVATGAAAKQLPKNPKDVLRLFDLRQLLPQVIAISETLSTLRQLSRAVALQTARILDAGKSGFPEVGLAEEAWTRAFGDMPRRTRSERCAVM
eukprot:symbB.v1.2.025870.t1/scaffold2543.1/size76562/2